MPIEEFKELRRAAEALRSEIAIQLEIVRAVEDKLTTSAGAVYAVRNLPTEQIRDSLDKAFKQVVARRRAWPRCPDALVLPRGGHEPHRVRSVTSASPASMPSRWLRRLGKRICPTESRPWMGPRTQLGTDLRALPIRLGGLSRD